MVVTTNPRNEQIKSEDRLVIHHRKARNAVMMIPSRIIVERPQPKDPITRQPRPNIMERKKHRVWLDNDGNGEVCGAVWQDICDSGYANHFLVMPNTNAPLRQGMDLRPGARSEALNVTSPEAEGEIQDQINTTFTMDSTKVRMPNG